MKWLLLAGLVLPVAYCALVPPPDQLGMPYPNAEGEAGAVTTAFWEEFQADHYQSVARTTCAEDDSTSATAVSGTPALICELLDALRAQPSDATLPNIAAAGYNWRMQRRVLPEDAESDLQAGRRWAARAVQNGNDMAAGFEASPTWLLGFLTDSDSLKQQAYDQMVEDTRAFPAFHGFVEGASLPPMLDPRNPDPRFDYDKAIDAFLRNIDACFFGQGVLGWLHVPEGVKMNRFLFNGGALVSWVTGRQYCYNNPASPFNMQGLYIAQGDAYLKRGDLELARIAYENALKAPNGDAWVYSDAVRYRLANMQESREKFLADSGLIHPSPEPTVMVAQSSWYCASCHYQPPGVE